MHDTFNLHRYLEAQDAVYPQVLLELASGEKRGHWMWFIFPQIKGLGSSSISQKFAISSRLEAMAYARHPVLGERLNQCTKLVIGVEGRRLSEIFSYADDLKFCSSMTLFAASNTENELFRAAIGKYCEGKLDQSTLGILARIDQR